MAVGDIGKSQICDSNPSVTFGDSSLNTREPPVYVRLARSGHASRDDGHLVDLVGVAAAGEVVDGCVQTLQDGAVGLKAAEPLGDLVADVAGFDAREDEGVGVACDLTARELQLTDDRGDRRVKLHFAVDGHLGRELLRFDGGVVAELDGAALAGALGGEGQQRDLRVDAEELCRAGGLDGHFRQLLGCGEVALSTVS